MYRSPLVPLDGSHFSEHALPVAASIARQLGAALTVVRVQTSAVVGKGKDAEPANSQTWQEEQTYLRGVVHRLAGAMQVRARDCLLRGEVADSLLQFVRDHGIDLVVMTTHGRSAFSRLWLGSVADVLLRRLPIPLLLVRPQRCLPVYARHEAFRHVLIALDGSPQAEEIIEPVLALALGPKTSYTLLRVVEPPGPAPGATPSEAQGYLDRIADRLGAGWRQVQTLIRFHVNPAAAILREVCEGPCDLLAMTTHGRSGLNRFLLGSVTEEVIRKAECPVLTVRAASGPSGAAGVPALEEAVRTVETV
jgi:nucleotide-binding universal stress UspA family protein